MYFVPKAVIIRAKLARIMLYFGMNMQQLPIRQKTILEACLVLNKPASYGDIAEVLSDEYAERTIKRDLSELVEFGYLSVRGGGRSTEYQLTLPGRLFLPVDADQYTAIEPDIRVGVAEGYQFSIWEQWPQSVFFAAELAMLDRVTATYRQRSVNQSPELRHRELERFIIEMSWKSSKIEGNTYTLLDTELLLKEGIPSKANTKEETQMILNHKQAFGFLLENESAFKTDLSFSLIETLHQQLMSDLLRDMGIRTGVVGITGSRYQPLDNQHQLREAIELLVETIGKIEDPFSKALTALLGISYIQPFTDGNKRTARLLANGILLAHECAPLSYRDVDERTYRASLLVFYERLSLVPMKQLFFDQYHFSSEHYSSV
jgi:fido (protein-threonine AMPylation protein)